MTPVATALSDFGVTMLSWILILVSVQGALSQSDGFNQACVIINSLHCRDTVKVEVCGSDGVLYKSECRFAKAHCLNASLYVDPLGCNRGTNTTAPPANTTMNATQTIPLTNTTSSFSSNSSLPPQMNSTLPSLMNTTLPLEMNTTLPSLMNTTLPLEMYTTLPSEMNTTSAMTNFTTTVQTINITMEPNSNVTMEPQPNVTMETMTTSNETNSNVSTATTMASYVNTTEDAMTTPTTPMLTVMPQQTSASPPNTSQDPTEGLSFVCKIIVAQPCTDKNSPVCASGLTEYPSLCDFSKAQCYNPDLRVLNSGACPTPTTAFTTNTTSDTTTDPTTEPTTDSPSVADIICNVILSNPCNDDDVILCGSDGITYSNSCEYEKERCVHPTLAVVKPGKC